MNVKDSYTPLDENDIQKIHDAAMKVLEVTGMGDPPESIVEPALAAGCHLNDQGRMCFPRTLIEDVVKRAGRMDVRPGRDPEKSVRCEGPHAMFGCSGVSPIMHDFETNTFRRSTLEDLYDIIRLSDKLENVHALADVVVSTDLPDAEQDINKAYAFVAGTTKPFTLNLGHVESVEPIARMYDMVSGGEGEFRKAPFCTLTCCPTVSPMKFESLQLGILLEGARLGFPSHLVIAAMAGTTSPTALAGTLVQTVAEALACLAIIEIMYPGHPVIVGMWPFVADLRTGAFSGGGGEEALMSAGAAQILNWYGLTGSVSAGITDSKEIDVQAGFEKGISTALATLAKGGLIGESYGMLSSLMGASLESMVIDNENLAMILRIARGMEVSEETLSVDVIDNVANKPAGNYLKHKQTRKRMKAEYVYPKLADRSSVEQYKTDPELNVRTRARKKTRELMASHYPQYVEPAVDSQIRETFPIKLPVETMSAETGNWKMEG